MKNKYKKKLLILMAPLIFGSALAIFFICYYRYLPLGTVDNNQENFEMLQERAGLVLNADTKFLVATDGEPRDGTKGYFYWVFFSENLPTVLENRSIRKSNPNLNEKVKALEAQIWPFKVKGPSKVNHQNWTYKNTEARMSTITGRYGSYSMIETFQQ